MIRTCIHIHVCVYAGACQLADETVDTESWTSWVRDRLCPELGNYEKDEDNSIVVLDNVTQHWSQEAIRLITSPPSQGGRGAVIIFLPPYSPEFNPVCVRVVVPKVPYTHKPGARGQAHWCVCLTGICISCSTNAETFWTLYR